MSDEKSPSSRLAKSEKTQFTYVNEYFSDKHNEEIGVFAQTLIRCLRYNYVASVSCIDQLLRIG